MENLLFAINLFPAGLAFYFWIMLALRKNKDGQRFVMTGMIFYSWFYFTYQTVFATPGSTGVELAIANIMGHAVSPMLLYVIFLNLYLYHPSERRKINIQFLFGVAIFLTVLTILPILLTGWDDVVLFWSHFGQNSNSFPEALRGRENIESFYSLNIILYYCVTLLALVLIIVYIVYCMLRDKSGLMEMWNFWFHGMESTTNRLTYHIIFWAMVMSILRILIGRYYAIQYPWMFVVTSVILSICMLGMGFLGLASGFDQFTRFELFHPMAASAEAIENTSDRRAISVTEREEALIIKQLRQLFEVDYIFTNPMLTIEDVAVRLNSNRVYVSHLIDMQFHMSFRDYLVMKRIEYAKSLMLQSQNASLSQHELAQRCGFTDAATFNKRFTQLVGITPNRWRKANTSFT